MLNLTKHHANMQLPCIIRVGRVMRPRVNTLEVLQNVKQIVNIQQVTAFIVINFG